MVLRAAAPPTPRVTPTGAVDGGIIISAGWYLGEQAARSFLQRHGWVWSRYRRLVPGQRVKTLCAPRDKAEGMQGGQDLWSVAAKGVSAAVLCPERPVCFRAGPDNPVVRVQRYAAARRARRRSIIHSTATTTSKIRKPTKISVADMSIQLITGTATSRMQPTLSLIHI